MTTHACKLLSDSNGGSWMLNIEGTNVYYLDKCLSVDGWGIDRTVRVVFTELRHHPPSGSDAHYTDRSSLPYIQPSFSIHRLFPFFYSHHSVIQHCYGWKLITIIREIFIFVLSLSHKDGRRTIVVVFLQTNPVFEDTAVIGNFPDEIGKLTGLTVLSNARVRDTLSFHDYFVHGTARFAPNPHLRAEVFRTTETFMP